MEYQAIIGIECHVQLDTSSKMFCRCPVGSSTEANSALCEVCTGQPGSLPTVNDSAIGFGVRAGLALGCEVHERSIFARKNYFYPDLPKGYQISQFDRPLCTGGAVHVLLDGEQRRFPLTRIHLEEDAGKMIHTPEGTFVDWNRAGIPLAEVVSEAEMHTPEEAEAFVRMLHRVMVRAGVTQGNMQKGQLRFDANISVHKPGEPWGTKVEVKNLNSFRFMRKALEFEFERQLSVIQDGGEIIQETRTWTGKGTAPMRTKEGSSDYRYFPDPDLPPLEVTAEDRESQLAALPACPLDLWLLENDASQVETWKTDFGLSEKDVGILKADPEVADFFRHTVESGGDPRHMYNWVKTEVLGLLKGEQGLAQSALLPIHVVDLQRLMDEGTLARADARTLLAELFVSGGDVSGLVAQQGLVLDQDEGPLREAIEKVLDSHPTEITSFQEGNDKILGFLMGQVMRASQGKVDPKSANRLLREALEKRS